MKKPKIWTQAEEREFLNLVAIISHRNAIRKRIRRLTSGLNFPFVQDSKEEKMEIRSIMKRLRQLAGRHAYKIPKLLLDAEKVFAERMGI